MNNISLKTIIMEMWEKKIAIIIIVVVCTLALGGYGYKKSQNYNAKVEEKEGEESYATRLANIEEAITNATEGVEAARESYNNVKEYNDNSLYMKLDPENVYVASLQYAFSSVWTTNANGESVQASTVLGDVMQSYILYMNDGDFRKITVDEYNKVAKEPLAEDRIRELIANGITNNIVQVKMLCIDETMANNMQMAMTKAFEAQKKTIESVQGVFNMEQIVSDVYNTSNIDVRNYQNARNDELKNNDIALNDQLSRQSSALASKDSFLEDNEEETAVDPNPKKEMLKWLIFGFILGVALPFAFFFIRYIISGRIKSTDELLAGGLSIAGVYKKDPKAREVRIRQDINGLMLMATKYSLKEIFVWSIASAEENNALTEEVNKILSDTDNIDFSVTIMDSTKADPATMKKMSESGCALLACKLHKNTYEEIERQRQMLKALEINVLGCLVVE